MSGHAHEDTGGHLRFCDQCDRFFDARSGCEADIRFDERARLREKVEAKQETVSGHLHAAFQSGKTASTLYWKETGREEAFREVLALLAEPGETLR